jgi:hypothetical protein
LAQRVERAVVGSEGHCFSQLQRWPGCVWGERRDARLLGDSCLHAATQGLNLGANRRSSTACACDSRVRLKLSRKAAVHVPIAVVGVPFAPFLLCRCWSLLLGLAAQQASPLQRQRLQAWLSTLTATSTYSRLCGV